MTISSDQKKVTSVVLLGTVLEYYDFLLFAHLGFIITPLFFPNHSSTYTHILSLALFGLSFVIRPIGGFIFGRISDKQGRKVALIKSVKWAVFPAMAFALLPTYETIGVVGSLLFVCLRLLQGIALGGEYPVAGTYLMEINSKRQGLISALLVGSGTVGSLLGLGFAVLCLQPDAPAWLWRVGFLIGGIGSIISYYMRKYLGDISIAIKKETKQVENLNIKRLLIFVFSLLASITMWLPATYSNFYVTKILQYSTNYGLYASFICLISYILILPFVGMIYDKIDSRKYLLWSIITSGPITILSFSLLTQGHITWAQLGLVVPAAFIGAPIHRLMNNILPASIRSRNIGLIFMTGLSFGGLLPSISSYVVEKTRLDLAPAFLVTFVSLMVFFCFYKYFKEDKLRVD